MATVQELERRVEVLEARLADVFDMMRQAVEAAGLPAPAPAPARPVLELVR